MPLNARGINLEASKKQLAIIAHYERMEWVIIYAMVLENNWLLLTMKRRENTLTTIHDSNGQNVIHTAVAIQK